AKLLLFAVSGLLIFAFIYVSLYIAQKMTKKIPVVTGNIIDINPEGLNFDFKQAKNLINSFLVLGAFLLSFFIAFGIKDIWDSYLKYMASTPFGKVDPLFGRDIGFYVFELPFIKAIYGIIVSVVVITFIVTAVYYLFNRGIGLTAKGLKLAKAVEVHLSVLAAIFFVLMAYGTKLMMFNLLHSGRGIIYGAGYTDIYATLPVLWVTLFLNLVIAGLFIYNIYSSDLRVPLYGIAFLLFVSILGSGIYAGIVQKLYVSPNEIVKESPYIKHNIEFTRMAYNLDKVDEEEFPAEEKLTKADLARNDTTIRNIRLWDHRPLLSTYAQLQEIRTYYQFYDVDVDRYMIDGKDTQVMLSPRELSAAKLPSKIWINEHLTYTHGYGVALSPVNVVKPGGLPELFVKDIPPTSIRGLKIDRPEIYYGEIANDYVFVGTKSKEFDYPMGDKNKYAEYEGTGGITVNSIWRKLGFAMKFGNLKILMSSDIKNKSRIMINRKIAQRVKHIAPFLRYDNDPYMIIVDGKLLWILDGYSVTDMYPYSDPTGPINYIRNSVKVVIDAYNGSVDFYVSDPDDPIIRTYSKIFPVLFRSMDDMPKGIRAHVRYPEAMFGIQMNKYKIYHMTNPQVFYNKEDVWDIANETYESDVRKVPPYYTIMKLPGEKKEEFILMIPFTPIRKDNMSAWMCARSDGENYGKLIVYVFPKKKLIYGPMQIEARIDQNPEISQQLSLWSQRGSRVIRGNTLVIPIKKSLLYIEPLYIKAERGQLPELKRVIVAFGDDIAMEPTLADSLNVIFGAGAYRRTRIPSVGEVGKGQGALVEAANKHYRNAISYQKQGNWARYGEELDKLGEILNKLKKK
ncbi:UPF0182 family protein, partial [Candidatus Margulisiibacteriota bacterium]